MDECRSDGHRRPAAQRQRLPLLVRRRRGDDPVRARAIKNLGQKAIETIVTAREQEAAVQRSTSAGASTSSSSTGGSWRAWSRPAPSTRDPSAPSSWRLDSSRGRPASQRERDQGQVSMFDLLAGPGNGGRARSHRPSMHEWEPGSASSTRRYRLLPVRPSAPACRDRARTLGVVGAGQLAQLEDGAGSSCGLVSALREINTKNGNRMGFATIEDVEGSIEVTILELFRQSAGTSGAARRSWSVARPRRRRRANFSPTTSACCRRGRAPRNLLPPQACRVEVRAEGRPDPIPALRAICEAHRGTVPLPPPHTGAADVDVRPRALRVRPSASFVEAVEQLLGPGSVTVDGGGRSGRDRRPREALDFERPLLTLEARIEAIRHEGRPGSDGEAGGSRIACSACSGGSSVG